MSRWIPTRYVIGRLIAGAILIVFSVWVHSAFGSTYGTPISNDWRYTHGSAEGVGNWAFMWDAGSGTRATDASWLLSGATLEGFDSGGIASGCATLTNTYDHDVMWVPWPDVSTVTTATVYAYQAAQGTMLGPVDNWAWCPRMASTEQVFYDGNGNEVHPGPSSMTNLSVPNGYGDALLYAVGHGSGWEVWSRIAANHNNSSDTQLLQQRVGASGSAMYVVLEVYEDAQHYWHRDRFIGWSQSNGTSADAMGGWSREETATSPSAWTQSDEAHSPHFKAPVSMVWRDAIDGSYGYSAMAAVNGLYNMPGFVAGSKFLGSDARAIIGSFRGFADDHPAPSKTMQEWGYHLDGNTVESPADVNPGSQSAKDASATIPSGVSGLGTMGPWVSQQLSSLFSPLTSIVNQFFWWATALQNWGQ